MSLSYPYSEYRFADSIEEIPEYDLKPLNLGAETPRTGLSGNSTPTTEQARQAIYEWSHSTGSLRSSPLARRRSWRSLNRRGATREVLETDCGICFEPAVRPARTLCCGKLFCHEHITEWLHGSSSDGLCPSCQLPCGFRLDSSPSPKPSSFPVRRPSVDELFRKLRTESSKIYAPSPVRPMTPSILSFGCLGNPDDHGRSESPTTTASLPLSSQSSSGSSEQVASPTFSSVRQRNSSSHLYEQFHVTATQADQTAWVNAGQTFLSPDSFVFLTRSLGTLLSVAGMLVVLFVLVS